MKPDFDSLAQAYVDGSISPADLARLNAFLREDSQARLAFSELLNLDSALAALAAGWEPGDAPTTPQVVPATVLKTRWLAASLCTLAILSLLVGAAWWWQSPSHSPAFATVTNVTGSPGMEVGSSLDDTPRDLPSGTLSLTTTRGARIVIEAPASFRFESAQRLQMRRGRLAADVPPSAKGFTVVTPSGDAIDLGTRFGVDVPEHGSAEIHVFQGEVIAQPTGATQRTSVRGGDAVTLNVGGSATRDLRTAAFIQQEEVTELHAGLAAGQRARAELALRKLREDPALIALKDFESPDSADSGVFRRVQGRWPGSHAPEFIHVGDHLKLDVGGERAWPQLTLAAWVRIDRLGEPYQSLLHTDGWSRENAGQVHWMITQDTTMRLALIGNVVAASDRAKSAFPDSRTAVLPEQGRWVHLAVVYDSERKSVRFFLNGRFDSETLLETALPARLGPAQIGNWNQRDRKLSGRVDEVVLLGRAMSDAEVRTLHAAGNPYR